LREVSRDARPSEAQWLQQDLSRALPKMSGVELSLLGHFRCSHTIAAPVIILISFLAYLKKDGVLLRISKSRACVNQSGVSTPIGDLSY
jgi:hypothetical protein